MIKPSWQKVFRREHIDDETGQVVAQRPGRLVRETEVPQPDRREVQAFCQSAGYNLRSAAHWLGWRQSGEGVLGPDDMRRKVGGRRPETRVAPCGPAAGAAARGGRTFDDDGADDMDDGEGQGSHKRPGPATVEGGGSKRGRGEGRAERGRKRRCECDAEGQPAKAHRILRGATGPN